jgi:hypothetical protein
MPDPVTTPVVQPTVAPVVPPTVTPPAPAPVTVPEKFLKDGKPDYEALTRSYLELEKKNQPAPTEPPAVTPPVTPPVVTSKVAKWTEEWNKNEKKLSEATYAEIQKDLGLSKDDVDEFIANKNSKVERQAAEFTTKVFESAGGKEKYTQVADWADTALTPEQIEPYNEALKTGNLGLVQVAFKGLVAMYEQAKGKDPQLLQNTAAGNASSAVGFDGPQHAAQAKQDPRYGRDTDYTKLVSQRLKLSKW